MIRAVLDVNVLVAGFPAPDGVPGRLIDYWLRRTFVLVSSDHILAGVERAWSQPYLRTRYRAGEQRQAIALLRGRCELVTPDSAIRGVAENEEDDPVLATAVAGYADALVTGDRALRALDPFEGVAIKSPRAFLALLEPAEGAIRQPP